MAVESYLLPMDLSSEHSLDERLAEIVHRRIVNNWLKDSSSRGLGPRYGVLVRMKIG